ncbi:MAG TPA: glycoside hydrolase family 2 TIM barrel-domain containing protein [Tepidisphaeraceae bacterium]|jgi:hypothetical protein|nr:glycoside hydrolase family 2 TIM barrel-domain containing protein [Tepidisphaeraceae bacterium]
MSLNLLRTGLFIFLITMMLTAKTLAEPTVIERDEGGGWRMLRGGQPYVAKGVCIWGEAVRLDELVTAGGNSVRAYDPAHADWTLKEAGRRGLTVMLSFDPGKPRHGFDYKDEAKVLAQRERFKQFIRQHKDDPALLVWSVGNEVEFSAPDADAFDRALTEMNVLAGMARAIDPNHPVGISLAGMDERRAKFVTTRCPNFQYVGINSYGGTPQLPAQLDAVKFDLPYFLTEFGPNGHWEVPTTAWDASIEPTSTEKEQQYIRAHAAVSGDKRCLGSYAFYWDHKQELTATWYGMFLKDGRRTGVIDAMTFAWTGRWADTRAPRINAIGFTDRASHEFKPGEAAEAVVSLVDEKRPVKYEWSITHEAAERKLGGDFEPDLPILYEGLHPTDDGRVAIAMPTKPGAYRLCLIIANDDGRSVATANLCFRVKD